MEKHIAVDPYEKVRRGLTSSELQMLSHVHTRQLSSSGAVNLCELNRDKLGCVKVLAIRGLIEVTTGPNGARRCIPTVAGRGVLARD